MGEVAMAQSKGEAMMQLHIRAHRLPQPSREHKFHSTRKWRFDFAWTDAKVAVEVDGLLYGKQVGRHQTAKGYANDCDKMNAATLLGWRVLHFTPESIKSGLAIEVLCEALYRYHPDFITPTSVGVHP